MNSNKITNLFTTIKIFLIIFLFTFSICLIIKTRTSYDYHSFTKAICSDNNYCIDVLISCNLDRVIDVKPITEGMYFDSDLVNEYRNQTHNESWCK